MPWNVTFRALRAEVYMKEGSYYKAIDDYKSITKLKPDSMTEYLQMSKLHYALGDLEDALR